MILIDLYFELITLIQDLEKKLEREENPCLHCNGSGLVAKDADYKIFKPCNHC